MSLALLRDGPLSERKSGRAASLRKRSSRLRALNAVTAAITQHVGLAPSLNIDFDSTSPPSQSPSEVQLLNDNDISKGLYFRDAVLPVSLEAVERLSVQISTTPKAQSSDATKPMLETDLKTVAPTVASNDTTLVTQLQPANEPENNAQHVPPHEALATKLLPVDPSTLVQPISEHRPRTIHLPSKEVQEERIRERQQSRSEAHARDLRESERAAAEPASSPSSTNGAWSATTPAPAEHSPVTSADEEAPALGESPAKLSKDTQAAIDARSVGQPDSLLEAQKEIARLDAIGEDLASPDVQLRLEQEQAVKATRDAAAKLTSASAVPADPRAQGALIAADPLPTLKTQAQIQVAPRPTERDVSDSSKPQAPAAVLTKETTSDTEFAVGQRNHIGSASPVPGRMITRVSSGAMRHKSVSEIMGNSPKISTPISKRLSIENVSPMAVAPKSKPLEPPVKPQQRPKTEIVSSAPSRRQPLLPANSEGYEALRGAAEDASKDYLEPLFRIQIHDSPGGKPLHELLQKSSKVVSTTDQFAGVHEKQDQRILRRIYQLQNANRWSLRQMEPCPEPAPPKSHMDHLLGEMKWMRTDFRQERKTKKAAAKFLAEECVEWVKSDEARRCAMQVDVKPREVASVTSAALHSPAETTADTGDKQSQAARSPPGLDASVDGYESVFEEFDMPRTPLYANVPSSFFSAIHMDKDSYHLQDSDSFHDAIADLPIYMPFDDEEDQTSTQLLAQRTTPAVSKFCEGKILAQLTGPPKKRSRFDYEDEEELSVPSAKRLRASQDGSGLAPEQTDVALFDPENKLLRDRLHSNTAFRPPSEFPMPSSQFYEYRYSSQWVADDDQLLRRLAKEYSFNWSLIADRMSMELPSTLSGAADRRSPWECFERWVELESLPNEMRKTLYFKTWNQRLEAAQQKNDQRYQLQLQAQNSTPGQPPQIMRRRTQPVRVEKRRGNRYLHIVDAMRKLARKREQQAHKQAEAQKAASLRKQHENAAPKGVVHTPQEFSRLRHQKDVEYANHQEKIRQHMLAQQRMAQMQRSGQHPNQQQANANASQTQRPNSNAPHGQNPQLQPAHGQQGANNQMHSQGSQQGNQASQRNGHLAVPHIGMQNNIPQAQMQPNMRGGSSGQPHQQPENIQQRMALEAQRQAQMKNAQLSGQQFQMPPPNRASPGGVHGQNATMGHQSNQAMMAAMQASNNAQSPAPNSGPTQHGQNGQNGNSYNASASPMPPPANPMSQPQQLSSGHVPSIVQITHQLKAQYPQATSEQITQMTNDHLKKQVHYNQQAQAARQNALNAAAGSHGSGPAPNTSNAYSQNQAAFQQNAGAGNTHGSYNNGQANGVNHVASSSQQQQYANTLRQRMLQQQSQLASSPVGSNVSPRVAQASPSMAQASPNMTHVSPSMAQSVPNNVNASRSATPQMARINSSGGGGAPMQSPGLPQGSPRAVPAGVARQ